MIPYKGKIPFDEMRRISRDIDELIGERGKLLEEAFSVDSHVSFVSHGMTVTARVLEVGFDGLRLLQTNTEQLPLGVYSLCDPWSEHYQLSIIVKP